MKKFTVWFPLVCVSPHTQRRQKVHKLCHGPYGLRRKATPMMTTDGRYDWTSDVNWSRRFSSVTRPGQLATARYGTAQAATPAITFMAPKLCEYFRLLAERHPRDRVDGRTRLNWNFSPNDDDNGTIQLGGVWTWLFEGHVWEESGTGITRDVSHLFSSPKKINKL